MKGPERRPRQNKSPCLDVERPSPWLDPMHPAILAPRPPWLPYCSKKAWGLQRPDASLSENKVSDSALPSPDG